MSSSTIIFRERCCYVHYADENSELKEIKLPTRGTQ